MTTLRFVPRSGLSYSCLAGIVAVACLVSACSTPPPLPENDLFREASLALEDESYSTAISDYKKLLEEYPFSDKAEIASLNIAFAHYLKEEYGEAVASFNDFERLYPVSPLLPFVSYNIGMCWLEQAKDGKRDATASDEALRQFRKVAAEFPRTIYADLAVFRQQEARENLAGHELVVADFYRQHKNYDAAVARYRFVIREYPATENAVRAKANLKDTLDEAAAFAEKAKARAKETADAAPVPSAPAPAAPAPAPAAPATTAPAANAAAAPTGDGTATPQPPAF